MWCIDKILPRLDYRFLPVDSRNLAERGTYFSQGSFALALPFYHVRTRGDGVAHARAREAIVNIM